MKGIIAWFAHNTVAANLLMWAIIIGGVMSFFSLDREIIPQTSSNEIRVTVPYLGAGPAEVEDRILIRVEEAVADLEGVKEIRAVAREGLGTVTIEVADDYAARDLLNDVKSRIDAINTFPPEAERPIVAEFEPRHQTMLLAIYGDTDPKTLKRISERLKDDISALAEVDITELQAVLPYEVAIEVSEPELRRFNLAIGDVARAVRENSLNLPAGTIRAESGNVTVRTRGQAYTRQDFEDIVVLQQADGAIIRVGDIATVIDGFEEADLIARYNGAPATLMQVFVTDNPDIVASAQAVRDYLERVKPTLPEGLVVDIFDDSSESFSDRLSLLLTNGFGGLILVFVVLLLFLRPLVALWVAIGIAIAFMGAVWMLAWIGVSLNMISLFAFLLVLGIVVDDAIIVGESIHAYNEQGYHGTKGAVSGTKAVAKPVFFAVATTIMAFTPMFFVPGVWREVSQQIPFVVTAALIFSLVESMLILPSHLSGLKPERRFDSGIAARLQRFQRRFADGMHKVAEDFYRPLLLRALAWRGLTIVLFVTLFGLAIAVSMGGWMRVAFFPSIVANFIFTSIEMPEGAPFSTSADIAERLEAAGERTSDAMEEELGYDPLKSLFTVAFGNSVQAWTVIEQTDDEAGSAQTFAKRWRDEMGELPEAEEIKFTATFSEFSKPIQIRVASADLEQLDHAVDALKNELATYAGVYDIRDSLTTGQREILLDLKPQAQSLSLGLSDLANQVRQGFYGAEAQRIPRGKDDVRVMVRYPRETRESVDSLSEVRVRTAEGLEIPFEAIAEARYDQGYTEILRIDRERVATVTAELRAETTSAGQVIGDIFESKVPEWRRDFPGTTFGVDGDSQEQQEFVGSLLTNLIIAIAAMYALLAIAFRSYGQPFIILTAIPFGFTGAIIGHLLLGLDLSMFSFLGIVAAAGVVVNDNLVLIDRINHLRHHDGFKTLNALLRAGRDRFRPIILTSVTTFVGLIPIISETSIQAQFLIPMVVSLAFGVLFATPVTLILVPCLYSIGYQLKHRFMRLIGRRQGPSGVRPEPAE